MFLLLSTYIYSEDNLKAVRDEEIHQWFAIDILANGHYPSYMDRFF